MSVPRFTTPTFVLNFSAVQNLDLTEATNVYVTFNSGRNNVLTKTSEDLTINEKSISVYLTQVETGIMSGDVEIQANWTMVTGNRVDRVASEVVTVKMSKQLLQKVIE